MDVNIETHFNFFSYFVKSHHHCSGQFFFFIHFLISGTEHPREDNPDLYYWAEITDGTTHTNI